MPSYIRTLQNVSVFVSVFVLASMYMFYSSVDKCSHIRFNMYLMPYSDLHAVSNISANKSVKAMVQTDKLIPLNIPETSLLYK